LATPAAAGDAIELIFKNHLQYDMVEQHVYVEREPGSGLIYRVTPPEQQRYADAPVFAAAESVANAPMTHGAVGPYQGGTALGFTLGDWLAGTGTGTYECDDGVGTVNVTFDKLVPNAVYTMWYALVPRPELDPFVSLDIPLGARDGSQSPFTTDGTGHAEYEATFSPCLQLTGIQVDAVIAIAWHSDGKTYGATPGPFSTVTHVQIWANLPFEE
jgi:hypothetical protein